MRIRAFAVGVSLALVVLGTLTLGAGMAQAEPLSLTQVARAVNMSSFYFCKVFRAGTGVRFTDYLARARVERTKQLLLKPHVRVSEAAFEAGFQSLSQFNRVFRRVAGESPSTHREHLHGTDSVPRSPLAFAA